MIETDRRTPEAEGTAPPGGEVEGRRRPVRQASEWTRRTPANASERRDALAERDRAVAELEQRLAEREDALRSLLDTKIAHERQIERLCQRLDALHASRSWRVTAPLRLGARIVRAITQPRTHGRQALLYVLRAGYAHMPGSLAAKARWRARVKHWLGDALVAPEAPATDGPKTAPAVPMGSAPERLARDLESLVAAGAPPAAAVFSIDATVADARARLDASASTAVDPRGPAEFLALVATESDRRLIDETGDPDVSRARTVCDAICADRLARFLGDPDATLSLPKGSDSPRITVVLVLYGRAPLTFACLESLQASTERDFEVVIVDNASPDETSELLDRIRGATILRNCENLGFLRAVNQAFERARGEQFLMLNNDAQVFPHSLGCAADALDRESEVGAVGGRIVLLDGSLQEAGSIIWKDGSCLGYARGLHPDDPRVLQRRYVDYCSGAFLMVRSALFRSLGGFDERFAPAYYEEADLCMTLRAAGHRVLYEPDAAILHYEFASSRSPDDAIALQVRNRAHFEAKHRHVLERDHLAPDPEHVLAAHSRPAPTSTGHRPRRVLILDDRVPHRALGQGLPRANDVIQHLRARGAEVTHYATTLPDEHWRTLYADIPREVELIHGHGVPALEEFLRERSGHYDHVVVSRPHNMGFVRDLLDRDPELLAGAEIIYDAEAIFSLREAGRDRVRGRDVSNGEVERVVREEVALASDAQRIVAVSEREAAQFRLRSDRPVHVLGHRIDARPSQNPHAQRAGFLFIGPLLEDGTPNVDGVAWFVDEVWPELCRALPDDALLHLVGATGAVKLKAIEAYQGRRVRIHGFVPDVSTFYETCRVFVVPTRYAGGIPYKAHEAAAHGLPMVASSLIGEQLGWRDGDELCIGANAQAFAEHCLRLHEDGREWLRVRENALRRIGAECSPSRFDDALGEILGEGTGPTPPRKAERSRDAGRASFAS